MLGTCTDAMFLRFTGWFVETVRRMTSWLRRPIMLGRAPWAPPDAPWSQPCIRPLAVVFWSVVQAGIAMVALDVTRSVSLGVGFKAQWAVAAIVNVAFIVATRWARVEPDPTCSSGDLAASAWMPSRNTAPDVTLDEIANNTGLYAQRTTAAAQYAAHDPAAFGEGAGRLWPTVPPDTTDLWGPLDATLAAEER